MSGRHAHPNPSIPSPRPPADEDPPGPVELLRTQLAAAGWEWVSARDGYAERWRAPSQLCWIVLPLDVGAVDYPARLGQAWDIWAQVLADAGRQL